MPYISPQRVKEVRNAIKKEYPAFKISVTCENYSTVMIKILEGPMNFQTDYTQVNVYYISEHFVGLQRGLLLRLYEIANAGNRTESEDSDYGSIPSFYVSIHIGSFERRYKYLIPGGQLAAKLKKLRATS